MSDHFEADYLHPNAQLAQRRARDGRLGSHPLISIVRLTVETNILTSKCPRVGTPTSPRPRYADASLPSIHISLSRRQYDIIANGRLIPGE